MQFLQFRTLPRTAPNPQVQRTTDLTGERDSGDLFRGACTTLEDQPVRVFDTAPVGDP